jgi:hypothetical protein
MVAAGSATYLLHTCERCVGCCMALVGQLLQLPAETCSCCNCIWVETVAFFLQLEGWNLRDIIITMHTSLTKYFQLKYFKFDKFVIFLKVIHYLQSF